MTTDAQGLTASQGRSLSVTLASLPMLVILVLTLLASVGETLHSVCWRLVGKPGRITLTCG